MRLHYVSFDAFIEVGTVGMYWVGSRRVSWPNSRATAICIHTILWSLWQGDPVGRAKIFMKVETRGRNATVSNTARAPLTPLTFNKVIEGLFMWNACHFGINEICRSVSDHIGLLFEEVTTESPCWRANRRDWNCLTNEFCCYIFEAKYNLCQYSVFNTGIVFIHYLWTALRTFSSLYATVIQSSGTKRGAI